MRGTSGHKLLEFLSGSCGQRGRVFPTLHCVIDEHSAAHLTRFREKDSRNNQAIFWCLHRHKPIIRHLWKTINILIDNDSFLIKNHPAERQSSRLLTFSSEFTVLNDKKNSLNSSLAPLQTARCECVAITRRFIIHPNDIEIREFLGDGKRWEIIILHRLPSEILLHSRQSPKIFINILFPLLACGSGRAG